ncbi:UNVERIFIED_CONTAM: hypothetical protein NCL1_11907 [Trichonephila clavipes]
MGLYAVFPTNPLGESLGPSIEEEKEEKEAVMLNTVSLCQGSELRSIVIERALSLGHQSLPPTNLGRVDEEMVSPESLFIGSDYSTISLTSVVQIGSWSSNVILNLFLHPSFEIRSMYFKAIL